MHKKEKALGFELINKALDIDSQNFGALYNKSRGLALQNELDLCLNLIAKIIKLKPTIKIKIKKEKDFDNVKNNSKFNELINN